MDRSEKDNIRSGRKGNVKKQESTRQKKKEKIAVKEYLFKVLVIGDLNTGKTSLIKRYVQHSFSEQYRTTIGVDFALKVLEHDEANRVRLQLWDIAGQEKSGNMTRVYYKDAVGCIIVYDVNNEESFKASERWKNDLDEKILLPDGDRVPCLLFGNKKDIDNETEAVHANMKDYCRSKGYSGWFEGSAKHNINIDEAFHFILSRILKKNKEVNLGVETMNETLILSNMRTPEKSSSCCITKYRSMDS